MVSHFQTVKEITDLGLLDKDKNGAVLPFVNEDGDIYSHTSTVNSTVNMRDNDDDQPDDKEDLESVADSSDESDEKKEDEDKTERPKSSSPEDKLVDAEVNE